MADVQEELKKAKFKYEKRALYELQQKEQKLKDRLAHIYEY